MKRYIKNGDIKYLNQILISSQVSDDWVEYSPATSEEEILNNGWLPYENLEELKKEKIEELVEYDKSSEINTFTINGITTWLDRDTRSALVNAINSKIKLKENTFTLWLNNIRLNLNCESLLNMLANLEIYAQNCFDTTEQHKVMINTLDSIEKIKEYNYTLNYPEKLVFNL